jgi:hypothetical protein
MSNPSEVIEHQRKTFTEAAVACEDYAARVNATGNFFQKAALYFGIFDNDWMALRQKRQDAQLNLGKALVAHHQLEALDPVQGKGIAS